VRQDLIKLADQYSESALDKHARDVVAVIKQNFIQRSIFKYHE
ncbi:30340_t:CDS:1, partial [Racocetra persica]